MTFAVLAIAVVATLHMIATTVAALPTNAFSAAVRPATSYVNPYFSQNWRLFAPEPISSDRTFWVRGEFVDDDGAARETDWFDWSDVELDLIRQQLVGGRAGYITSKLIGPLGSTYGDLTEEQRELAADDDRAAAPTTDTVLRSALIDADGSEREVELFLQYEEAAVRLTTAALAAVHPEREFTAVQYRIGRQPVVPYDERALPDAEREAARPEITFRESGWRAPIEASAAEQRTFDRFLRRHE